MGNLARRGGFSEVRDLTEADVCLARSRRPAREP